MTDSPSGSPRDLMLVEEPGFDQMLRCVFGLGERDVATYLALARRGEVSAGTLAEDLDRDRSNVVRSLDRLREKDVASRHRELLDDGGEVYCYEALPLPELKARMHDELDEWTAFVHGRIDAFERGDDGTVVVNADAATDPDE